MFTAAERERIRAAIVQRTSADPRISGVALTGSAAANREDGWSDIDLAFGVASGVDRPTLMDDYSAYMTAEHGALHSFDMRAGEWVYRVFLLPNTLQVDLAFVAEADFRALADTFRLVSGRAAAGLPRPTPALDELIGMGWLYALHARSCIARGLHWQAEYMISGARDTALALACVRLGLPSAHGRSMDRLPPDILDRAATAIVCQIDPSQLRQALHASVALLSDEIGRAQPQLHLRLSAALMEIREV